MTTPARAATPPAVPVRPGRLAGWRMSLRASLVVGLLLASLPAAALPSDVPAEVLVGAPVVDCVGDVGPVALARELDSRCERWAVVHDRAPDPAEPYQQPSAIAVGADGDLVAAAGYGAEDLFDTGGQARSRWRVLGLDGASGDLRWLARPGPTDAYARPLHVAVDAAAGRVLATGWASSAFGQRDARVLVTSLDAGTGAVLWDRALMAADLVPGTADARGWYVAATADGDVAITGTTRRPSGAGQDLFVATLDGETGDLRGVVTVPGIVGGGTAYPVGMGMSADGATMVVGATSDGRGPFDIDMLAIGVDVTRASGPAVTWSHRDDGRGAAAPDRAQAFVVDPEAGVAYLTGISGNDLDGPPFAVDYDLATIALDVADGSVVWSVREDLDSGVPNPQGIAARDGVVVVVGSRPGGLGTEGFATALDAGSGATRWDSPVGVPGHDRAAAASVVVTGEEVVVTGAVRSSLSNVPLPGMQVSDSLTVGLGLDDGARRWTARHNATRAGDDGGRQVVADDAGRAFVLGRVTNNVELDRNFYDFSVLAY